MTVSCVFCGATENLTVSMNVKTARGESTVNVCAEHEDNASPKKVREIVEGKEAALAELEEKCKALGFSLVPAGANKQITVVQSPPSVLVQQNPEVPAAQVLSELRPTASSTKVESKGPATFKVRDIDTPAVAVDTDGKRQVNLGKEKSYDIDKTVKTKDGSEYRPPKTIEAETQVVSGRAGIPITIPKKIVSEAGRSDVKIVNTGGDRALQDRFKSEAEESRGDRGHSYADGYNNTDPRPCNFCDGTGVAKIGRMTCPRCKGTGELV